MFAGSDRINLKTLQLLAAAIINGCAKILVKLQLKKKTVIRKNFLLCSLLSLIAGNSLFPTTVFLYFTNVVATIHSSMYNVFILEEHLQP